MAESMLTFNTFGKTRTRLTQSVNEMTFDDQKDEMRRQELLAIVQQEEEEDRKKERLRQGINRSTTDARAQREQLKQMEREMQGAEWVYDSRGRPVKIEQVKKTRPVAREIQPDVYLVHGEGGNNEGDPRDEDQYQHGSRRRSNRGRQHTQKRGTRAKGKAPLAAANPSLVFADAGFTPAPKRASPILAPGVKKGKLRNPPQIPANENKENKNKNTNTMFSFDEESPRVRKHASKEQSFLPQINSARGAQQKTHTISTIARGRQQQPSVSVKPASSSRRRVSTLGAELTTQNLKQHEQQLARSTARSNSARANEDQKRGPGISSLHKM